MNEKRQRQHATLSAYLEPLALRRRVAVVGPGAAALADVLLEAGARAAHAYEDGPDAAADDVVVHPMSELTSALGGTSRQGVIELVIVPDVSAFADLDDGMMAVRRLVGPTGLGVFGASADGAVGYYEFYDAVLAQWPDVRMVGQVPFRGDALAVLGEEDAAADVTVDTQLAGEVPPTFFLAVGGPAVLRPYVIVQRRDDEDVAVEAAPARDTAQQERAAAAARERAAETDHHRAELATARLRAEVLESQLDEERQRSSLAEGAQRRAEQELSRRTDALQKAEAALAGADEERRQLASRGREVERALAEQTDKFRAAAAQLAELEPALARLAEIESLSVRAEQSTMVAEALDAELAIATEVHGLELEALEEALRERGRAVHALETELLRRDRMVKELLLRFETLQHGEPRVPSSAGPATVVSPVATGSNAPSAMAQEERARLHATLEALSLDAARREGELQALRWRIDELSLANAQASQQAPQPSPETTPSLGTAAGAAATPPATSANDELGRLRDELEMLRQAFRQEHEARVRAEGALAERSAPAKSDELGR